MKNIQFLLVFFLAIACSNSSDDNKSGSDIIKKASYVNWETIPAKYHPEINETKFKIDGIERIEVDIFGFNKDVEVVYSSELDSNEGLLKLYSVWDNSAVWGNLNTKASGNELALVHYGSYNCSIEVKNGAIAQLDGLCYVRLQVVLPPGAEIEVYNVGTLISKMFFPIDNSTFLDQLKAATWAEQKFTVIEDFMNSYKSTAKTPSLMTADLQVVVRAFSWKEEKFKVLRRLQMIVLDRENLAKMIEKEFNVFEREEALSIVGL